MKSLSAHRDHTDYGEIIGSKDLTPSCATPPHTQTPMRWRLRAGKLGIVRSRAMSSTNRRDVRRSRAT